MLDMTIPFFLCLLWSLVEVHSQTALYLTFNDYVIPNHSYVDLSLMMYPGNDDVNDTSSTVICHTDLTTCCRVTETVTEPDQGDWFFPDEVKLPGAGLNNANQVPIAQRKRVQLVRLQRGPPEATGIIPSGIYRCAIETVAVNSDDNAARETVYVGVYGSGGDITIPGGVFFTVISDLNGASPRFILTCISTGGPATTVTWTRDPGTVMGDEMTVFNPSTAATTAQYTHILTVTGRLGGLYTCTVSNVKPSLATASYTVQVAFAPTSLMAVVQANLTSVKLTWSPPTPLGDTTGYRIYYSGGSSGSEDVSGGSTDNYLLTGLQNGTTYNITIMGLSQHFFSSSSAFVSITLTAPTETTASTISQSSSDNTAAIIGGVVAVILIIAITVTIIAIVALVMKNRRGDLSIKKADKHELPVLPGSPVIEGVAITTTPNTAYEMMKQGGRVGGEYEVVNSPPGGPPLSKDLEGMYEVPSPPSSHQPMPAIPLPVAPPTSGNVGGAGEEAVYESIPGDK